MKRYISLILSILIIFSALGVTFVSAEDKSESLSSLPEVKDGFNRYFFLLPEDWFWDESNVVGIYWQGSDTPCEVWPGFEAHKADTEDVYYYDVPVDAETIIWNNHYINSEIDYDISRYNKRTDWLTLKNAQGQVIPSGMIATIDPDWEEERGTYPTCDWYCYYGNGEYGNEHTNKEENTYRYYFYLPEQWDTEDSQAAVYWWYPTDLGDSVLAEKTNIEGLYYCDVPQKATFLCFGNSKEAALKGKGESVYVECKYQRGKVFVIDFDKTTPSNEFSNEYVYRGSWYIYYGDGTFGVTERKGDKFYSCRSFGGDNPAPVIETNRYYFYMPEEWDNIMSSTLHVYWWEGTNHCGSFWPGYEANPTTTKGLFYYDVPKDVTSIIINNGVTRISSPVGIDFQSKNIGTEYYEPGESELYPDGLESFDNMVYVINFDDMYYELEGPVISGDWYYYYGDGEYGTTPQKGDVVYSNRQIGTPPNYKRTAPEENEMTLFFLDSVERTPVYVIYTVNEDGKDKSATTILTSIARSDKGLLSYAIVPEDIKDVYFFYNEDVKTHYIKKNLVHNAMFSFGTFVNGKYDYKSTLLTEDLDIIEFISGDSDQNGKVTIQDATLIQKYLAKKALLGGKGLQAADFNKDGKVTVKDATAIQKYLAKS